MYLQQSQMHTSISSKTFLLLCCFLVCITFTSCCVIYANSISKYLLLLICTSLVFYFLVAITFIQYIVFKEATYFYYIMYILLNVCYFSIIIPAHIDADIHLPQLLKAVLKYLPLSLLILSYYMYVQFTIHFLRLQTSDKKTYKLFKIFAKIYLYLFVIGLLASTLFANSYFLEIVKSSLLIICMPIGIFCITIIYKRAKNVIATILCTGSLFFFIGSVLGFLFSSNIIPYPSAVFPFNRWIFYTEMGTMLESIMFFSSFAYRNKVIIDEETNGRKKLEGIRNDIAKDLHDEIGSTLSSINILSNVSEKTMENAPMQAKLMMHQITIQSKTIQQNMSDIVWSLRSENEHIENLGIRIREYAAQTLEPLNISAAISFDESIALQNIPMAYRKELLLICKEAINNIAKHSGATKANITFHKYHKNYLLKIADNGVWKGDNTGTGTKSMKERAQLLGGQLTIANDSNGTIIKAIIPIP